jgi:WD40 repeat protein
MFQLKKSTPIHSLTFYPFKLPVLAMDISHDSKLIVTCSADKNVKIWGLDFGDCHKSIFAHEESVMQVAFEKGSHYFWTVGKDKMLKYWDGDKVWRNTPGSITHQHHDSVRRYSKA